MQRRQFFQAGAAALLPVAAPAIVRAQSRTTLRFVPYADLALVDPLVAAFVTRNHVLMVFDTLYALDASGTPQPQMLQGHSVEAEGTVWRLTLRDGLRFHDGTPVLARDAVASIRRWASFDAYGSALLAATDELSAPTDREIRFRLKHPFPLLPAALAKPTNVMCAIMPERLASRPTLPRLTEIVGSGPFRFLGDQRVPGARNVYARFEDYVPRPEGTPSFCAGPRVAHFDRVEWITTPDAATQVAALRSGEVDWVEQPQMDLVPSLRGDRNLHVEVIETSGLIGTLRLNHLHPPFDNPAIRRAVLRAVNQSDFMQAVAGENRSAWQDEVGMFTPGMPMANDAGMEALSGRHDPAALKRDILAAGYKGERVVLLNSTDVPRINAICEVGAQMFRDLGLNVDNVATDWGTVVQRQSNQATVDQGGWSVFGTFWGGWDFKDPAGDLALRAQGRQTGWAGWPTSPALEALRQQWLDSTDPAAQKELARRIQVQAFEDVTILPLGSYQQPSAWRSDLSGMLTGLPQFTNLRRS